MWQSRLENIHYSASVKHELTVLIKSLGLPLLPAQVPALFVACTSSDAHGSPLTSGHYIEYPCRTVDIMPYISGFTTAANTGQIPTVRRTLCLRLKLYQKFVDMELNFPSIGRILTPHRNIVV